MRRSLAATVAVGGLLLVPPAAHASCIAQTEEQQADRADVIFVGASLEGATETGVQRFRVDRYVKGLGPDVIGVVTGVVMLADGTGSLTSVSIDVAADERWRIYGTRRADGTLTTSVCAGSVKLASDEGGDPGRPPVESGASPSSNVVRGGLLAVLAATTGAIAGVVIRRRRQP